MDTTKELSAIEWCAGYGGIHLGLKRAIPSMRVIAYGEIEAFACANLVAKMEAGLMDCAPIWTDIKTFPCEEFRDRVGLLVAGYPCQPFSAAGKRLGAEDPRHLWPHIARAIGIIRPRICFFENVEGHISLGLREVIGDLGAAGYTAAWGIFSASECLDASGRTAPHQRKRVFILAHANGSGDAQSRLQLADLFAESGQLALTSSLGSAAGIPRPQQGHEGIAGVADHCGDQAWPSRPGEQQFAWEPPRVVVDAKSQRAGQRSELRSEECGSRSALPWDVEQSGEGRGLPNAQDVRLEEQSECGQQHQADGQWASDTQRVRSCQAQEGRPVEHASHWSNGEQSTEQQGRHSVGGSGEEGAMGNAASDGRQHDQQSKNGREARTTAESSQCELGDSDHGRLASCLNAGSGTEADRGGQGDFEQTESGQIERSMGLHSHGTSDGLGHSELSILSHQELAEIREWMVKCDNRTDELRLLGNGVVPATAERAFRVLMHELCSNT